MYMFSYKIGNAKLEMNEVGARLMSSNGYIICSINVPRKHVYFNKMKGIYDSDQVLVEEEPNSSTYNIIDNPDRKPSQFTRLEKLEQKLQEIQDEINCIRNND